MRKRPSRAWLAWGILLCLGSACAFARCGETPESALKKFVLTDHPSEYLECLPENFRKQVPLMDATEKEDLVGKTLHEDVKNLRDGNDDGVFLVLEEAVTSSDGGEPAKKKMLIREANQISDGARALIYLRLCDEGSKPEDEECKEGRAYAWLKIEDGDWKVTTIDLMFEKEDLVDFDDPDALTKERRKRCAQNEERVESNLWSAYQLLKAYSEHDASSGFPDNLDKVADALANADPAVDNRSMFNPCKDNRCDWGGYTMRYERRLAGLRGGYTLTARPEHYGRSGVHSYLLDDSGTMHKTDEDRAASDRD